MNIFITGTDTDVGKTVVSSWICHWTNAKYWKPIQTGCEFDKNVVKKLTGSSQIIDEIYKFKTALSPYDASNIEKIDISVEKIIKNIPDKAVIEAAGGILVPINQNFQMVDLIKKMNTKVLIVAKSKLGFLNHIFMTLEILKNREIPIIGIVLNGETEDFLIETIEKVSKTKVICVLPYSKCIKQMIKEVRVPEEIKEILK